jgi:sugar phosphate isomerase/epimerase
VAKDDWRLRIDFAEDGPGGLLGRLGLWEQSDAHELAQELKGRRLAVTEHAGTVFVYAGSSLELEQARRAIEQELRELDEQPARVVTEHWLADEDRWDDEPPVPDADEELLAEGFAPWEVRVEARDHAAARELADRLEAEGYGVVRRWTYVIAGCATREQAAELARRVQGEVEPGGELVWEGAPGNPWAIFGGMADAGGPI